MIHAKQILEGREIDENEAYALKNVDNDIRFLLLYKHEKSKKVKESSLIWTE